MKRFFRMYLAMAFVMLGAMTVSAADRISLQEVPFGSWNGWGADAQMTAEANCGWEPGVSSGLPYGDGSVINYSDLTLYAKLIVVATDGTPRFLFNRDVDEGQWNADEAQSHLIDNTKGGWSAKYFSSETTDEGTVYTVDLKQLVKDKGFAHLHSIKGANYANVTITSMELERAGKATVVGWDNILNNSTMEGEDVSSFFTKVNYGDNSGKVLNSEITDGVGVDGSRGIVVTTGDKTANDYDNQFWFRFNEPLPAGTKYRVTFDYKADEDASVGTQAHAEPSDYIHWDMLGTINFTADWNTFSKEGEVTADQSKAEKQFLSVAFNLNPDNHIAANKYYFDNIKFEIYRYGTTVEFSNDVILVDFGFDTNLPDLVKASGNTRLMYDKSCASVKVNGQDASIYSIEGFADGRFYIFLDQAVLESDEVVVSFKNPADKNFHLTFTSGPGGDVKDFADEVATVNSEIEDNEGYPYDYLTPVVQAAEPEGGSFNLPNGIKDFKVKFDKNVDCAALVATINGKAMTVTPSADFASEVTLTREGTDDLPTGEYIINITKIYPQMRLADEIFGDTTYTVNIGKIEYDPTDVPMELIDAAYFGNCPGNSIPEGFIVYFGEETRLAPNTYGSGARLFDFGAGGDFTKGLYFRDKYVEYGTLDEHFLTLTAGKKYNIHFNTAAWKDSGMNTKFQVLNPSGEVVLEQLVSTNKNVNGGTGAVDGSTVVDIKFFPEADGNYILRWYPCSDTNGTEGSFNEALLANVKVTYQPNQVGFEETMLLNTALENAKATRDQNAGERYEGEALNALGAAIEKYEAEKETYTAPSAYKNAAAALDAASQAVKDHRILCDNYDTQIKKTIDVVRQNAENKFGKTELYAQVAEVVAKYNGTSEWRNVNEDPEGEPNYQLFYSYDELKADDALKAAIDELTAIGNTASLLFTEGVSTPEGSNNGKGTGVAVFIDRLRLGAEDLKGLGVAEDDELVVAALNSLADDDALAENIKNRIRALVYGQLKEADNKMFEATIDEVTLEEVTPAYDMSVFVKNPNIYKQQPNMNFTDENVPGWTTPEGFNRPGLTVGWGQPKQVEGIAEDCMFQTWGSSYRVEQTITDLPAGVYTLTMGFGERDGSGANEGNLEGSFIYAKTSDTPALVQPAEGEEAEEEQFAGKTDVVHIGQSFPFLNSSIENIAVTDGVLTIGANAGPKSHTFFNDVRLKLVAPATGFDYAKAYQEAIEIIETGVDGAKVNTAKVIAIQLFDLSGHQVSVARPGVTIVKKYMSDGTIKTEKKVFK